MAGARGCCTNSDEGGRVIDSPGPRLSSSIQQPEPAHFRMGIEVEQSAASMQRDTSPGSSFDQFPLPRRDRRTVLSRVVDRLSALDPLSLFRSEEAEITDDRFSNIQSTKLEDFQKGYPRLAAFVNSDVDNTMFRRFGNLHVRNLLYKQAELTASESELNDLDRQDAESENGEWKLHSSLSQGPNEVRKELMARIDRQLKEYDELLLRDHQLRNLRKPSKSVYLNLFNYIWNRKPLTPIDTTFLYQRDDFVCLYNYAEFSWLDHNAHKFMDHDHSGLFKRLFVTEEDRNRSKDPYIHYYSRERLGNVISTLIAFLSTILLLSPVYILVTVKMSLALMATTVLSFVFLFAAAISGFSDAKRIEVFGATAAYCAVLVVFLGNLQQALVQIPVTSS